MALEVSTNATQWEPLEIITHGSVADSYTDHSSPGVAIKFYRARLAE